MKNNNSIYTRRPASQQASRERSRLARTDPRYRAWLMHDAPDDWRKDAAARQAVESATVVVNTRRAWLQRNATPHLERAEACMRKAQDVLDRDWRSTLQRWPEWTDRPPAYHETAKAEHAYYMRQASQHLAEARRVVEIAGSCETRMSNVVKQVDVGLDRPPLFDVPQPEGRRPDTGL